MLRSIPGYLRRAWWGPPAGAVHSYCQLMLCNSFTAAAANTEYFLDSLPQTWELMRVTFSMLVQWLITAAVEL